MSPGLAPDLYLRIRVSLKPADLDAFVALCWELGTVGLSESEASANRLDVYFHAASGDTQLLETLRGRLSSLDLKVDILDESVVQNRPDDWLKEFRGRFTGFPVGGRFWIHPPWERPSKNREVAICIEPGAAFGTGTHESTQLCLLGMEELAAPQSVLDVGTGSGILTVAALKLWPGVKALAIDNDPEVVAVARSTLGSNRLRGVLLAVAEPRSVQGAADLVIANLTRPILESQASELVRLSWSRLLVSGFTEDEEDAVLEAFLSAGVLNNVVKRRLRSWSSLQMERIRCTEHS